MFDKSGILYSDLVVNFGKSRLIYIFKGQLKEKINIENIKKKSCFFFTFFAFHDILPL